MGPSWISGGAGASGRGTARAGADPTFDRYAVDAGFRSLDAVQTRSRSINGTVAEAVLGLALAATTVVTALAIADSWGGRYWIFDGAAGVVAGALALLRRRHSAVAAMAGLAVAATAIVVARVAGLPREPGPTAVLALAVLTASAVRKLPVPAAASIAAGGFVVVVASQLGGHPPVGQLTIVAMLNALGWLAALATGLCLRLLDTTRRTTEERVRRDERLELARELHDVAAHHITGIVVQAQAARILARKRPERLDDSLAGVEGAGSEALTAIRRVVGLLRDADDTVSARSGPEQLHDLVRRFDHIGPAVRLRLPDPAPAWPPEVTSTVYRVVQESLTNVSRHAPDARSVTVTVDQQRSTVRVEVADDGSPPAARAPRRGGYGLIGMRERVETLGGTLEAGPCDGAGWSVTATVPVPAPDPR
jgi:signal transduction histidine kinase